MIDLADVDVPDGRALHLVDFENLLGESHRFADCEDIRWAVARYCKAADWQTDDLAIVATNRKLMAKVCFELPDGWQKATKEGHDGADQALLERATATFVQHRFHRLVVGSGDHVFAELAEKMRRGGGEVWVVATDGHVSERLARVASKLVLLDEPEGATPLEPTG
jgi:alkanesulfonate monooxygenase SsuD/methylene tetrahydromethanopterin reductase-like flavin-dependent oxidoreductase (luciferase family)